LNQIVEDGRRFANVADMNISDMSANSPVGTTLAILERTLKVMSAIQARVHFSMKQELKLLKVIIADYTPEDYDYEPTEGSRRAKKSDYKNVDVIPVSDPNAATMAQKIVQYQAVLQLAQSAPQMYNMPLLHRQMLEVLGIKNGSKLIPMEEDQKPSDPISENQNILMMKPTKAFLYQDHQAHITVHMSMMNDPKIAQLLQNNPQAKQMQAAMMAHINEHLGFEYRKQIEKQLGMVLPAQFDESGEEDHMSPEIEARLSPLLAQAAQQLLQSNQSQQAQQAAQQKAQDPLVQMQQQELQLKAQDVKLKEQKMQIDAAAKEDQMQIERDRISSQERIAGAQIGAKVQADKMRNSAQQQAEGLRIGVDVAKNKAQMEATSLKDMFENKQPTKGSE
jgi:hypothetical protein